MLSVCNRNRIYVLIVNLCWTGVNVPHARALQQFTRNCRVLMSHRQFSRKTIDHMDSSSVYAAIKHKHRVTHAHRRRHHRGWHVTVHALNSTCSSVFAVHIWCKLDVETTCCCVLTDSIGQNTASVAGELSPNYEAAAASRNSIFDIDSTCSSLEWLTFIKIDVAGHFT